MTDFEKDFPGTKIFKLERNYRSTEQILEPANRLISKNKQRHAKKLWTKNEPGEQIREHVAFNDIEEAEYVAATIKRLVENEMFQFRDIAVLMRINALSRILEEKMISYGINHQIFCGFKFFERKEVKDALAYFKVFSNPKDNDAFLRVLAFPKKGIGEKTAMEILVQSKLCDMSMFEWMMHGSTMTDALAKKLFETKNLFLEFRDAQKKMSLTEFADFVVKKSGIIEAIGNKTEEDITRQLNVKELLVSISQFADANEEGTLDDYLQNVTLLSDIDNLDDKDNRVSIMTVHSAKGLEFPLVFIVGLVEGVFPLSRAINSLEPDEMEEERRLMYVAVTRAKQLLYLTSVRSKFLYETRRTEIAIKSRFIKEMLDSDKKQSPYHKRGDSTGKRYFAANRPEISEKEIDINAFAQGEKVSHSHFGDGVVTIPATDPATGFITVKFDKVGIKTLSLKFAPLTKKEKQ